MKILIWGKTYPELSRKYRETVCTGGCTESGDPIRLYPVPLRYYPDHAKYSIYDWIEVPVEKSTNDPRPESYKVVGNVEILDNIPSNFGWKHRQQVVFSNNSWQYDCLEYLKQEQQRSKTSLGVVKVRSVSRIWIKERSTDEMKTHEFLLKRIKNQTSLFEEQGLNLEFQSFRIHIEWNCKAESCPGHTAGILDWGLGELGRKKGSDVAIQKMIELSDVTKYDLRFFMGNFKAHPHNFGIVGLWYPKLVDQKQQDLFM